MALGGDNLFRMNTKSLITDIDKQIAKLQHARTVLLSLDSTPTRGKRGRPAGSANKPKRRKMSAEGRAKIAAAQKKRWAAAKKTSA
jgi:hypothetical protein